jgi:hypothetical protein
VQEAEPVQPSGRQLAAVGVERERPPCVAMRSPPSTNGPLSPFAQKPIASSQHMVMKLKPSYISASCTSLGFMSVRVHSCAPRRASPSS